VTRDYDVVLFGATGFTGSLTAEYLSAQTGVAWALAGRNAEKLAALRDRIRADVPILVADSADAASGSSEHPSRLREAWSWFLDGGNRLAEGRAQMQEIVAFFADGLVVGS